MTRVVIVGGGIAGLAAAYYCLRRSWEQQVDADITVLEASERWGGKIRSERMDGFLVEAGPDAFLTSKPWALQLCTDLGLGDRLIGTNPATQKTYILHDGRLESVPDGLTMMVPGSVSGLWGTRLLSGGEKLRASAEWFIPRRAEAGDESLGAFISRRLGRGTYENIIEPLMSGIYAGDGDQLSLDATFPGLKKWEQEYGSLIKAAREQRRLQSAPASSRSVFQTVQGGLETIVTTLVTFLEAHGVELRLHAPVRSITPSLYSEYHLDLENAASVEADVLILAAPAPLSGKLVEAHWPALAKDLEAIPYASTATISLAYRLEDIPRPLDGYGYVIPRREGRRALACTWTSTKFPERAPAGYGLLRVYAGRAGEEARLPEDESGLIDLAREEVAVTLGITAAPVLQRAFLWKNAMPQFTLGHLERLAHIEAALNAQPHLALAGNGYRGVGLPDCIRSGELAARKVLPEGSELHGSPEIDRTIRTSPEAAARRG